MQNTEQTTKQKPRYFVPKPMLYQAKTLDGSKESAEELAKWINHLDHFRHAEVAFNEMEHLEPFHYVVYEEDSGDEFVMPGTWVVCIGNGSFVLREDKEFDDLFEPASQERLVEEGLSLDIPS